MIEELQKKIKCSCIYFALSPESCQNWDKFTSDFLQDVPSNLASTSKLIGKVKTELKKWEVSLNSGIAGAARRREERKPRLLDALELLWKKHLEPAGTQVAFIMLDDLHYFPLRKEESAYLTLRTTFQELVNRMCNYSPIITAPTLLFTDIAEIAEPLGRFFKLIDLNMFSFEDAKEAIGVRLKSVNSKVKVSDDVIKAIFEKTEGHPHLVIFTMYELLNLVQSNVIDIDFFNMQWVKIEALLGKHIFSQKFLHASPAERRLLIEIAKKDSDFISPGNFSKFKGASRLFFARLEEQEILIRSERGKYRLFHPLFTSYLRKQQTLLGPSK